MKILQSLAFALRQAHDRHYRELESGLVPLGITLVQWNALDEIDRNAGASLHKLAEATFNSDQAFGALASRLLRLGFVKRQAGAGRAIVHNLTPKGEKLLHQGREIVLEAFNASFAPLNVEERMKLLDLLTKLGKVPEVRRKGANR